MPMRLDPADIDLCARVVAFLGGDQPEPVRASLNWVIRNRVDAALASPGSPPDFGQICREMLWEATGLRQCSPKAANLSNSEWCRIYAVSCLVWAGDLKDETNGAIACHRHDTIRKWARTRVATALLGSFIFYR
jgi:hypothetical protein